MLAVIVGSTLVGIGTAISYAAMPTLIMAAVPITETASANGLNSLLRAIGTSTSSAAVAAVLGSVTMHVGSVTLPSFTAFQDVFWMAGLSALTACAVRLVHPGRPAASAARGGAAGRCHGAGRHRRPARTPRSSSAAASCSPTTRPVHPAVITVMKTDGTPVDWSRADNDGNYSVVLPGPGPVPGAGQRPGLDAAGRGTGVP